MFECKAGREGEREGGGVRKAGVQVEGRKRRMEKDLSVAFSSQGHDEAMAFVR